MISNTTETCIPNKVALLESTIRILQGKLEGLGIHVEEKSWLNEIEANLTHMEGKETLNQAQRLVNCEEQYLGLGNLGSNMKGSKIHQQLLAACRKIRK
jgi:hypothetical protein